MTMYDLEVRLPTPGAPAGEAINWIETFYEAAKTRAPRPAFLVRDLVTPVPHVVRGSVRPHMKAVAAPRRKRMSIFGGLSEFPGVVLATLLIYSLGMPFVLFGFIDRMFYAEHGKSLLGPAMDVIFIVFGSGLITLALIHAITRQNIRHGK